MKNISELLLDTRFYRIILEIECNENGRFNGYIIGDRAQLVSSRNNASLEAALADIEEKAANLLGEAANE